MNLADYDVILVNSSGGKDSQAMLDYVTERARAVQVGHRIVVAHADLGRMEWAGTKELAEEQAQHYGHRFEVVQRKKHDLLTEIRKRGKWPSATTRYCTSYYKREPVLSLMTKLTHEVLRRRALFPCGPNKRVRILNCYGFRAEESSARAKRKPFTVNKRATNGFRLVEDWLPLHTWSEKKVWTRIRKSGVRHHQAYDLGMPRLSCCFCIFAPKAALMIAGKHNPELLDEYVQVEKEIGHRFRVALTLVEVKEAIDRNEQPGAMTGVWNM